MAVLAAWSGVDPSAVFGATITGVLLGLWVTRGLARGVAKGRVWRPLGHGRWLPTVTSTVAVGAALRAAFAHLQSNPLLGVALFGLVLVALAILSVAWLPSPGLPSPGLPSPGREPMVETAGIESGVTPRSSPALAALSDHRSVVFVVAPFVVASAAAYLCLPDTEISIAVAAAFVSFVVSVWCNQRWSTVRRDGASPDASIDCAVLRLTPLAVAALAVNAFAASGPKPESAIAAIACVVMASIVTTSTTRLSAGVVTILTAELFVISVAVARVGGVRADVQRAGIVSLCGIVVTAITALAAVGLRRPARGPAKP